MNALLKVLKYEWPNYIIEESKGSITFRIFNEEIDIYNDGDILLGAIRFTDDSVIVDLSTYDDAYLRSSLIYFLVKVVSSTFTGVPILVAGSAMCY
jgi:hypothetical protein